jgi:hypothetical protein
MMLSMHKALQVRSRTSKTTDNLQTSQLQCHAKCGKTREVHKQVVAVGLTCCDTGVGAADWL